MVTAPLGTSGKEKTLSTQVAEKTTYAIAPGHTAIEFVIRHLMITR
jgi:polyisoprenoid-binding protein YceI